MEMSTFECHQDNMKGVVILACVALCYLWGVEGLSFPNIVDDITEAFYAGDVALKAYINGAHTKANRQKLSGAYVKLKEIQTKYIESPMPQGPFARFKTALRPVTDELVNEIAGALGITNQR